MVTSGRRTRLLTRAGGTHVDRGLGDPLIGALRMVPDGDVAIGMRLGDNTSMVAEGMASGVARTSTSMTGFTSQPVRLELAALTVVLLGA